VDVAAPSDEALVAAYVRGGPDGDAAFDQLVTRYERRVFGICYRYFGDAAEAEDAAQEAFVILLRRASTFTGAARFSTWLYRVTTNACHDLARRRGRRPRTVADLEELSAHASAEDPLTSLELAADLERALAVLDPVSRQAVVLHDVHGLPYADVGERLGLPVGTVKSRIHRSHARLADALRHLNSAAGEPADPPRPPTPR
jgi:RNA polymerase sigma-70 factor (ECF subfamily)